MKFLLILFCFSCMSAGAQIPRSGTYIYNYCDGEYNKCLEKCKVVIKGKKIWVYAPPNLTIIKEGELFDSGTLTKDPSGKWLILQSKNNKKIKQEASWIDFKNKRFWTF